MTDDPRDMAHQRVDHALRRFQEAWEARDVDVQTLSEQLDELDVAVELWLDEHETAAEDEAEAG